MPRQPRSSFGGQNGSGIWWRKRLHISAPNDGVFSGVTKLKEGFPAKCFLRDDKRNNHHSTTYERDLQNGTAAPYQFSGPATVDMLPLYQTNEGSIGWDDDLCRPIYHHRNVTIVSSEGDDDDIDEQEGELRMEDRERDEGDANDENSRISSGAQASMYALHPVSVPTKPRKKRNRFKTYGGQILRKPLSLILSQEGFLSEVTPLDHDGDRERVDDDENETKRQRRSNELPTMTCNVDSLESPATDEPTISEDVFDFKSVSELNDGKYKKNSLQEVALERQREFFAELDKNQKLIVVDWANSPSSPEPEEHYVRPSPRFNFSNPRKF